MANFTNENAVREKFQLDNTTRVPAALVEQSITDAHTEILRYLAEDVDTASPEDGLVLGETLLAGAHVYLSLASKDAFEQTQTVIGGQRVEAGHRFAALLEVAGAVELQAWRVLEPYLTAQPSLIPCDATDTASIIGGN